MFVERIAIFRVNVLCGVDLFAHRNNTSEIVVNIREVSEDDRLDVDHFYVELHDRHSSRFSKKALVRRRARLPDPQTVVRDVEASNADHPRSNQTYS